MKASQTFYPKNKNQLSEKINILLDNVDVKKYKDPIGFICPHAGYKYSGEVAASSYKYLKNREYEKVIILAPNHFDKFSGINTISDENMWTPLGGIKVVNDDLIKYGIKKSNLGFGKEHSLEVQLPFLQTTLKEGWSLVPLVMGDKSSKSIYLGSKILEKYVNKNNLIIISSDLSHFYPYEKAVTMDTTMLRLIEDGNISGLEEAFSRGEIKACGFGPIMSFLKMLSAKGLKDNIRILDYKNSKDTTGKKDRIVGYASVGAFWDN